MFASQTSGSLITEYTSSTKYQYNPSTGLLTATGFSGSGANLTNIPNSALTNSSFTLGSTSIALGSTTTTVTGLNSVTSTTFVGALTGNASSATSATTATTATNATNTAITDNTSSTATWYPTIVSSTSGNLPQTTSSTKLSFVPSTGTLTATTFAGTATTATNLAGGANGSVPYQTSSGATTFLAAGTNGYVMTLAAGVPTWAAASGGLSITDDTTTNATRYLTFTSATTGSISTEYVSSTKLKYNPSTGDLTAPQTVASNGLVINAALNTASYTISTGQNAMSVGPFTTASGTTITVPSGSRWVIL